MSLRIPCQPASQMPGVVDPIEAEARKALGAVPDSSPLAEPQAARHRSSTLWLLRCNRHEYSRR